MKRVNINSILLGLVLLIALSMRLWGINYDLPYIYHPDEPWPIRIGHHMLVTGDFNPHFFDWPSLIIYVNLFIQKIYYSINGFWSPGVSSGITNPLIELVMGVTYSPVPNIVLLGRLVTVGLGIGTVAITIRIGKELSQKLMVGLLAGVMLAISPTNVSLNRFITPDSYATFFVTAVFLASVFIFQQGETWAYVMAGLCLGLAVSSKYNSGMIIIAILAGHFFRTGWRGFNDYRLYLTLFLGGLTFVATTPYSLLDFSGFYTGFLSTGQHYSTGHAGMEGDTLKWYLNYMWQTANVIYLLAGLEILRGLYSRSKEIILLSIFPLVYFIFISSFIVRNDRTLLPVTPFLFLLAASFLAYLIRRASELQSNVWRKLSIAVVVCLALVSLVFPISKTFMETIQLTTVTSRETARIWVNDNLPTGAKIAIESYSPFVDPARFSVQGLGQMIEHNPEWYLEQDFDYLIFGQGMFGRFYLDPERYGSEISQYDDLFERFNLIKTFTDGGYEVRIYQVK